MSSYMTLAEVSEHYRTSPATIRYWRQTGYGPKGTRVGRRVLFHVDDVRKFDEALASQKHTA